VQTVEVEFVLQTRSHDHAREVIETLARKGFQASLTSRREPRAAL